MKNSNLIFLIFNIMLVIACEKDETINETEEELAVVSLSTSIQDCSFEPTTVSTITGNTSGYKDGTVSEALFYYPAAVVFDTRRQIMYVSDWGNNCIRAVENNKVTTFVGGQRGDREGKGLSARLDTPMGMTIDQQGNLFVVDRGNHKIRKITPNGTMSTFAGSTLGYSDGRGTNAQFYSPYGITIDTDGTLYVTDEVNAKIRYIKSDGSVGTLAGSTHGYRDSNNPYQVQFKLPRGIDIGPDGHIYVADYSNHKIRRVTKREGRTTTFAGSRFGNSNGSLSRATFAYPTDIVCDKAGNFFIADNFNHRIRFIHGNEVGTLTGASVGDVDGTYDKALFRHPRSITVFEDNLYVADMSNHSIRKIAMEYDCY